MSTPRAESISQAHGSEPITITSPTESLADNKVGHYAALARVMQTSLERFVVNDESGERLNTASSRANLRRMFADSLVAQTRDVLRSPEFADIHGSLQQSQSERVRLQPNLWDRIEENLTAGAHTFVNTTEAVYDILESEFSSALADSPDNAQLLDRLAKLNISQFVPYRDVYLETFAHQHLFTQQLRAHGSGVHFKPGYPLNATVPTILAAAQDIRSATDFSLDGQPVIKLCDIPEDRVTLGCPITFYKGQVSELWQLYTNGRQSLRHRSSLGAGAINSGGSAEYL